MNVDKSLIRIPTRIGFAGMTTFMTCRLSNSLLLDAISFASGDHPGLVNTEMIAHKEKWLSG